MTTLVLSFFDLIFFILADKKDNYKSLNQFVFVQDSITYYGVTAL